MAKQIQTTKHIQKQNIIDMMQSDEQLNMYDETLDQSTTQNQTQSTIANTPANTPSTTIDHTKSTHNNKVSRIIQKRPAHYSVLMQDGTRRIVHKSMFDKQTMTIKSDE